MEYDAGDLDDMERLALAARRDPERWGARYQQEKRKERVAALAQQAAALGDVPANTGCGTNPSSWKARPMVTDAEVEADMLDNLIARGDR